jgi:hypothetical protein
LSAGTAINSGASEAPDFINDATFLTSLLQ